MRARARQATEILKTQLLWTGTIEPLVALYFDDHIEQAEFEDPSVLDHFDVRTAGSFDYLRTLVGLGLNGSSKHLIREYRLEFSSLGSLEVEYLVSLPQHPVGPG
jgi:hypothetical protein